MRQMSEERLVEKVQSGEFGWKEYIQHSSNELKQEYELHCKNNGLDPEKESSAQAFMEAREEELDKAFENGEA